MIFKPAAFSDGWRGLLITVLLLLVEAGLIWLALSLPVGGLAFLCLLAGLGLMAPLLYLAWRAWLCFSLSYWIDRNAVTAAWGPLRQVIPISHIEWVVRGADEDVLPHWLDRWPRAKRFLLIGPYLGASKRSAGRVITSLASRPLAEQLVLVTDAGAFGLSPAGPDSFLQALKAQHELGPTHLLASERRRPALARASIWRDRLGLALLAAGFVGGLLLLGLFMTRYSQAAADARALILLPAFALAVWLVNGLWGVLVHQRQRIAANLLWAGTLAAQAAILIALLSLSA